VRFGIDLTNFGDYADPRNVARLAAAGPGEPWGGQSGGEPSSTLACSPSC
jgi:hypothetical protein